MAWAARAHGAVVRPVEGLQAFEDRGEGIEKIPAAFRLARARPGLGRHSCLDDVDRAAAGLPDRDRRLPVPGHFTPIPLEVHGEVGVHRGARIHVSPLGRTGVLVEHLPRAQACHHRPRPLGRREREGELAKWNPHQCKPDQRLGLLLEQTAALAQLQQRFERRMRLVIGAVVILQGLRRDRHRTYRGGRALPSASAFEQRARLVDGASLVHPEGAGIVVLVPAAAQNPHRVRIRAEPASGVNPAAEELLHRRRRQQGKAGPNRIASPPRIARVRVPPRAATLPRPLPPRIMPPPPPAAIPPRSGGSRRPLRTPSPKTA